jgi:two-component system NarL family sensor kinase
MNKKDGPWNKGGVSLFVCDDKGLELVSARDPEMVGKNFWDYKDDRGVLVTQEEWKLAKAKGKGWLNSMWNKPGETKSSLCRVYLTRLQTGGKDLLVGAYYYM